MLPITRVWHDDDLEPSGAGEDGALLAESRTARDTATNHRPKPRPHVSIVLVACSGHAHAARALDALGKQTYPSRLMEIIVVCPTADASVSRVVAALARQRPGLRLRCVHSPRERGMAAARNRGWRCAAGAIVGFMTDQVIPAPGWIDGAVHAFDPVVDVVGGQVVVPLPARPSPLERRTAEHVQAPWTAHNVFYRRRLLHELDGFDEAYSSRGHDDTDLILAAISAGARFCAAESAVVVHTQARPSWREELSRQMLHADEARLYRKHPRLYAQYVRPSPPITEYLALAALAGTMLGALTRRGALRWASAALWIGITALRFQRTGRGASSGPQDVPMLLLVASALPPVVVALRLYGAAKQRVWFF